MSNLSNLPDNSRVWIFPLSEISDEKSVLEIDEHMNVFLKHWEAHSKPVHGAYSLRHRRFLIVAADIDKTAVSGCSIDSLFREVEKIANLCSLKMLSNSSIFYLKDNKVIEMNRNDFKQYVEHGSFHPSTIVFNNTVQTVGEFKKSWEIPFSKSWHAQAFKIPE